MSGPCAQPHFLVSLFSFLKFYEGMQQCRDCWCTNTQKEPTGEAPTQKRKGRTVTLQNCQAAALSERINLTKSFAHGTVKCRKYPTFALRTFYS